MLKGKLCERDKITYADVIVDHLYPYVHKHDELEEFGYDSVHFASDVSCMDKFSSACNVFSLTISTTEVMYQPAPQNEYSEPSIAVNSKTPKSVDKFTYLGSTLARNVRIIDDAHRIAKASAAFGKLSKRSGRGMVSA